MMKYTKIVGGTVIALVTLLACASISSQINEEIVKENKPKHHAITGFQNHPFVETAAPKGAFFYLRRFWDSIFLPNIQEGHILPEAEAMKLLNSIEGDRVTWLGQASFLINISGKTILTDPFLTKFASPVSWSGPRRFVAPGIPLDKLPSIDIVIVSHSHYDHLDNETIRSLKNKDKIHVVVPLGIKSFFIDRGYNNVTELDWKESISLGGLALTALPAVHDSARNINDHNQTLWASWVIDSSTKKILFVGDTGYSETIFKLVGKQYGPFDYAFLPIGAYEPRKLMWMSHVTPEEAVIVGSEVRASALIASHWGTIKLTDEPLWEPPQRFSEAGFDNGFSEETLWVMKIGETRPLSQENLSQK